MSNGISSMYDDFEEYIALCEKFKEPVEYEYTVEGVKIPASLGRHHEALKARQQNEFRQLHKQN